MSVCVTVGLLLVVGQSSGSMAGGELAAHSVVGELESPYNCNTTCERYFIQYLILNVDLWRGEEKISVSYCLTSKDYLEDFILTIITLFSLSFLSNLYPLNLLSRMLCPDMLRSNLNFRQ